MGRVVATIVMTAGISFVALLTGALAQRFLYGENGAADPGRAELEQKIDDLSHQISELREALKQQG